MLAQWTKIEPWITSKKIMVAQWHWAPKHYDTLSGSGKATQFSHQHPVSRLAEPTRNVKDIVFPLSQSVIETAVDATLLDCPGTLTHSGQVRARSCMYMLLQICCCSKPHCCENPYGFVASILFQFPCFSRVDRAKKKQLCITSNTLCVWGEFHFIENCTFC